MLIITRKRNEAIRIGDVRVVVTRVSGNQVRLGFKTPPGMRAYREEIYENIRSSNLAARVQALPTLPDRLGDYDPADD